MIKRPFSFMCLMFLILQSILFMITSGHEIKVPASSIFQQEEGTEVLVTGQVYKKKTTQYTQVLYLKNNSIYDSNLIIYDSKFTNIPIGKEITIRGTIAAFDRAHNPGNFDQALYYAKEKIYGKIMCDQVLEIRGEEVRWKEWLYQQKLQWKTMLLNTLGEEKGAILAAMLLGEKSEMDADMKELYQKNGIGHILAISGLHISFIGVGIYKIIRKTGLSHGKSGLVALTILYLYAEMIGFSISVFRAFVMLVLKIGADMTGRVYDMVTALMFAAACTITYQPLYLTDAAFYLSYGAILGIILVLPALENSIFAGKKWLAAASSGMAVNLMLFPIQLWYYFEFPIYSLLLNLIVIPLMSLLLGAGMLGSIAYVIWKPAGILLLRGGRLILSFFDLLSQGGMKLPYARAVIGQPEIWKMVVYYLVLAVILLCIRWKGKDWKMGKWIWLMLVSCIALLICQPVNGLQVTMLDVGQGDGIFLRGPTGVTYFVDGGSSDVSELGKYRIEPSLKSLGVGTLDYVFISHGDTDHYSGISEMLQRQDVGVYIQHLVFPKGWQREEGFLELCEIAKEADVAVHEIGEGDVLSEGDLQISCLQAGGEFQGNEGSMVLEVKYGAFEMLFTGDVELNGEKVLTKKIEKTYDILKVGHHGSKNSSAEEFLDKVKPTYALISAGKDNSYGHPHQETLERLEGMGTKMYRTDLSGAITIRTDGRSLAISVFH